MGARIQCVRDNVKLSQARLLAVGVILASTSSFALAQKTTDNAISQAKDAFGTTVGNERTGLYNTEDVRGFSPVDAGNARIEGLYYDQIDRVPNRLAEGNTIHVGISALNYPFPAPTGLVDYNVIKPGNKFEGSLDAERGEYGSPRITLAAKLPLSGESLGLAMSVGARHQFHEEGGESDIRSHGSILMWKPYSGAEVIAFVTGFQDRNVLARPTFFPAGNFVPRDVPREVFLGQAWTKGATDLSIFGSIAKLPVGNFRIEAGLFKTKRSVSSVYADILNGVALDGSIENRKIIADGNNVDESLSGEMRLVREWRSNTFHQTLTLSLKRREKDRQFGGVQNIALGASSAIVPDFRPQPNIALGPENQDHVRQLTYGAAYGVEWAGHGSINVSLAKSQYRKTVVFADPLIATTTTKDNPLLWNISASVIATYRLAFYAGYVRGLEEALIAPDIATNRSESPPAIRTTQMEAGLRYTISPKLTFVGGLFSVKKPYFNLDPSLRYRQLGLVENRGIEISLAGQVQPGLSIVAGSVFLSPTITGEAVDSKLIGSRPVGSLTRRSIANVDWRLKAGKSPFSFDLGIESLSSRMANASNSFSAPARETYNIGARYRFDVLRAKVLLRFQVKNLLNDYGWIVSPSGGFTYSGSRSVLAQLVADF
jgi:iron complex outermembrane receptor protein